MREYKHLSPDLNGGQCYKETIMIKTLKNKTTAAAVDIDAQVAAYKAKLEAQEKEKALKKAESTGAFWDTEIEIGAIVASTGKSATKTKLAKKDDKWYIDIRKYVTKKADGAGTYNQHTTHGISLELSTPQELQRVIADIQRAGAKAFKMAK